MARIVFITGPPGVGKSTAVMRAAEELKRLGLKVGGMTSGEVRRGGSRVGFELTDLLTGEKGTLASVAQPTGPRVGKYRVNLRDLDEVGAKAIARAVDEADVVVIDEVGPMELYSESFKREVKRALDSGKLVLGTVHYKARDPLIDEIKSRGDSKLVVLSLSNRDRVPAEVAEELYGEWLRRR
ncbi:MAG: NTPase [Thermoprotei archaeon]|nr:MAG: NTPase [Thermoprotei archaeon]